MFSRRTVRATLNLLSLALACAVSAATPALAQPVVINFDELPNGTVLTNQYPSVTFSSANGNYHGVFTVGSALGSSPPNILVTASPLGTGETILDFTAPVNDLTFKVLAVNPIGTAASIDIFQNGTFSTTVPITGKGTPSTPVIQNLSAYPNITRIRIYNITDGSGIAYDDFSFDAQTARLRFTSPTDGQRVTSLNTVRGTYEGDIRFMELFIYSQQQNRWWNGSAWVTNRTPVRPRPTLTPDGPSSGTWSSTRGPSGLFPGGYRLTAVGYGADGTELDRTTINVTTRS